jgi:hypothetical protein
MLEELFTGNDNRSKHFVSAIRRYNLPLQQLFSLATYGRMEILKGGAPVLKMKGFPTHFISNVADPVSQKTKVFTVLFHGESDCCYT